MKATLPAMLLSSVSHAPASECALKCSCRSAHSSSFLPSFLRYSSLTFHRPGRRLSPRLCPGRSRLHGLAAQLARSGCVCLSLSPLPLEQAEVIQPLVGPALSLRSVCFLYLLSREPCDLARWSRPSVEKRGRGETCGEGLVRFTRNRIWLTPPQRKASLIHFRAEETIKQSFVFLAHSPCC